MTKSPSWSRYGPPHSSVSPAALAALFATPRISHSVRRTLAMGETHGTALRRKPMCGPPIADTATPWVVVGRRRSGSVRGRLLPLNGPENRRITKVFSDRLAQPYVVPRRGWQSSRLTLGNMGRSTDLRWVPWYDTRQGTPTWLGAKDGHRYMVPRRAGLRL